MTDFVVHSIPGSPYGRATLMMLEEKGQSYRLKPVAPGTFREPEHLARHPFGRVPVLEHGDFRLYETQAILRYLDRLIPNPPLTPKDIREAARMDQLMNINDWYFFQGVGNVIAFQRVVLPRLTGRTPDEAVIEAAMPKAHMVFDELSRLLGWNLFFGGEGISLADILLAPHFDFFVGLPEWEVLTASCPNLPPWMERMQARPSMIATTWERVAEIAKAA